MTYLDTSEFGIRVRYNGRLYKDQTFDISPNNAYEASFYIDSTSSSEPKLKIKLGKVPDTSISDNIPKYKGEENITFEYCRNTSSDSYGTYLSIEKGGKILCGSDKSTQVHSNSFISLAVDSIIKVNKTGNIRLEYNLDTCTFEPGYCSKCIFINTSSSPIIVTITDSSGRHFTIVGNNVVEIPANTAKKVELYVGENNELIVVQ